MLFSARWEALIHAVFWGILYFLLFSFFNQLLPLGSALLCCGLNWLILLCIAYINAYWIIPLYFRKNRFWRYILWVLVLVCVATWATVLVNTLFLMPLLDDLPPFKAPEQFGDLPTLRRLPVPPAFFLVVTMLFVSSAYALARVFLKKELQHAELEREKTAHELNFLRSQINPHFLFNALNNLHATIQLHPERAGDYVLKLGEMLRYVLEDGKKDKVALKDEIHYLENYLFFQRLKDEQMDRIHFQQSGEPVNGYHIEPMLFIPLVENAFMHSYSDDTARRFIDICLSLHEGKLHFTVRNNMADQAHKPSARHTGLGLPNTRRRLELLYPERHSFQHSIDGGTYLVELILLKIKRNDTLSDC
ncbi:MAG TPA: histidine kinase [Saprospiraceae bacterium]|mgnify:CR=1 FL=1|nr:histidine kinase [Saprospiraceae bacterium]HMQ83538.1 histidine kinase [Saprospiraceae bacterium]